MICVIIWYIWYHTYHTSIKLQCLLYFAITSAINLWFVFIFTFAFVSFSHKWHTSKVLNSKVPEFQKRSYTHLEENSDLIWLLKVRTTFYFQSTGYILCRPSKTKLFKISRRWILFELWNFMRVGTWLVSKCGYSHRHGNVIGKIALWGYQKKYIFLNVLCSKMQDV